MRDMYDSVTASHIPRDAQMVAGYVSGTYKWSTADWALFPNAVKVTIATQASVDGGIVLDVERGDATPDQAPGWVLRRRSAGIDPTIYCNQLNGWPEVQAAFRNQGVQEPHYWVARYDNAPTIPVGAVAKQYINPPRSGGHYDLSVVADYWPGIDGKEIITVNEATIADRNWRQAVEDYTQPRNADGTWPTMEAYQALARARQDSYQAYATALKAKAAIDALASGNVDLDALADKVADKLLAKLNLKQAL